MTDQDLKTRIKQVAVEHFDLFGFHGATIRNIAAEVPCSLPMVYYYYKSKGELFHDIIRNDYFQLIRQQAERAWCDDVLEFYTHFVCRLQGLSEYDRMVYRLGVKVYLHFDGDEELISVMDEWEKTILPRHMKLLQMHLSGVQNGTAVVRTLIHLLENLVESIVVKARTLSEEQVREEIAIVLAPILTAKSGN